MLIFSGKDRTLQYVRSFPENMSIYQQTAFYLCAFYGTAHIKIRLSLVLTRLSGKETQRRGLYISQTYVLNSVEQRTTKLML